MVRIPGNRRRSRRHARHGDGPSRRPDWNVTARVARAQRCPAGALQKTLWQAAGRMLMAHPVLGVGPDNFRLLYGGYAGIANPDPRVHTNNMYLEALIGGGLVAGAAFAWLCWRAAKAFATALVDIDHVHDIHNVHDWALGISAPPQREWRRPARPSRSMACKFVFQLPAAACVLVAVCARLAVACDRALNTLILIAFAGTISAAPSRANQRQVLLARASPAPSGGERPGCRGVDRCLQPPGGDAALYPPLWRCTAQWWRLPQLT